ncbi:MAG: M24 family metallopeptidase [Pseudomonadota bacterium]
MHAPATPLVNLPRARELMQAADVDGLIACLPFNVFYLSGYWGLLMDAAHFDAAFFAVLPAREDQPAALIMPSMELRRLVSQGGTWMPETFIFSSPLDDSDEIAIDGQPYAGWPVGDEAALTTLEHKWLTATTAQRGRVAGNARGALVRALRCAGLERARLVADDARVAGWLDQAGLSHLECHDDANLFRRIRLVKTAPEIDLLRRSSEINERAARAAVAAFRDGADWNEIENVFAAALAASGGRASYLMCGAGGPLSGKIRRDEPMFIDALSTLQHYHGDFGRCAVLGEPDARMRQRHAALNAGFAEAHDLLRPGTRFDDLADAIVGAVRRAGLPEFVYATPHSVGLEHTDDPRPVGGQQGMNPATVLEPGMVLNIDMPYTELGWGSVHIEDTILIKTAGFERLTSDDSDIICV